MKKQAGSIICEGGDQQGKSFTANLLHDILGYPVYHFNPPTKNTDFRLEYIQPLMQSDEPMIFDRSYFSEMAYGAVHRGGGGITPEIKKYVESFLNARNCIMVYFKNMAQRDYLSRDEMYDAESNIKVIAKYDELLPTIGIPVIQVDSFDPDCVDKIMAFYKKHNPEYAERQA